MARKKKSAEPLIVPGVQKSAPVQKRGFSCWRITRAGLVALVALFACSWLLVALNILPDSAESAATRTLTAATRVAMLTQTQAIITLTPATATATASVTPSVTPTPSITSTLIFTSTPLPTYTLPPTYTPLPTYTAVPAVVQQQVIVVTTTPLLVVPAPSNVIEALSPAQTYYIKNEANIRLCPSTNNDVCSILVRMTAGTVISVTAVVNGEEYQGNAIWLRLSYNGQEAYVHSNLATTAAPAPVAPVVVQPVAPVVVPASSSGGGVQSVSPAGATGCLSAAQGFSCGGDLYNCGDFCTYNDVQSYWGQCPGDPSRLDRDRDGSPCDPTNWPR